MTKISQSSIDFRDNPKLGDGNIAMLCKAVDCFDFRDNPKLGDGNPTTEHSIHVSYHFRDNPKLGDGNAVGVISAFKVTRISEITPN